MVGSRKPETVRAQVKINTLKAHVRGGKPVSIFFGIGFESGNGDFRLVEKKGRVEEGHSGGGEGIGGCMRWWRFGFDTWNFKPRGLSHV